MASTASAARSWPPAPVVEDEVDAVLREVCEDGSAVQVNRSHDVPVVHKGTIDQYPIIMPVEVQESSRTPDQSKKAAAAASTHVNNKSTTTKPTQRNAGRQAPSPSPTPPTPASSNPPSRTPSQKKGYRVRFVEPEEQRRKSQPDLDVEYLPGVPKYAGEHSDIPNSDPCRRRSSRAEADQHSRTSRRPSRRSSDDREGLRGSLKRLSWDPEQRNADVRSWVKDQEWYSDDEISSYRGTQYKHRKESAMERVAEVSIAISSPQPSRGRVYERRESRGPLRVTVSSNCHLIQDEDGTNGYHDSARNYNVPKRERSRRPTTRDGIDAASVLPKVSSRSCAVIAGSPSRPRSSTDPMVDSRAADNPSFSFKPCPRSIATAGHRDWYTIIGITDLDICPSCVHQMRVTRFRGLFIPSLPKPSSKPVKCSLSLPWARLAFVQTMRAGLNHLELLYQVTHPPKSGQPCTGRDPALQNWYRVVAHPFSMESGPPRTIPDFNACSACFRNLSILLPELTYSFRATPLVQERVCDLRADSTRFIQYMDLLHNAVERSNHHPTRYINLEDFIRYAVRKSKIYDCPRDHVVQDGTWHYIHQLPQFTVCEDCYDDVVWPVANKSVANLLLPIPQRPPPVIGGACSLPLASATEAAHHHASCYLYSPRMRRAFLEAVRTGDFGYLREKVLNRYEAETNFRRRKKLLLADMEVGYDRDAELRKNAEQWKSLNE